MKTILLAAAAAVALALPCSASAADLSGAWKIVADVGGMMINVTCNFTEQGSALSGTCGRTDADATETPVETTGSVDGATAKWAYDVKFQDMPLHIAYTANVKSDSAMDGTLDVAGGSGTFTATKQ